MTSVQRLPFTRNHEKSRSSAVYKARDLTVCETPTRDVERFEVATAKSPLASWPQAAQREARAHLKKLGLAPGSDEPLKMVSAAELKIAQTVDPRVTGDKMARAVRRATMATLLKTVPQAVLFGFSRLIDAKHFLSDRTLSTLSAASTEPPAGFDQLQQQIAKGPGCGRVVWNRPQSASELVASLVRQLVLGDGGSMQIQLSPELARWLEDTLEDAGVAFQFAMGGAGAFGANLAAAQPSVDAHFFANDPLPAKIADNFASCVEVAQRDGVVRGISDDGATSDANARVNYALEYEGDLTFSICGRTQLTIDGELRDLKTTRGSRIILGTPEAFESGFADDVDDDALGKLASAHDLFFFAGVHYFTKAAPKDGAKKARDLKRDLEVMKQENPDLVRHYQYVIPKVRANEAAVMAGLKGGLDSMSLNSVEISALLHRLDAADMIEWTHDPTPERDEAEALPRMIEGALKLANTMALSRVHLHGYDGDLLVTTADIDPERQVLAHLKARQIASMKTANLSGEIRSADDMWPVLPTVKGKGLAAVEQFADALTERFSLDEDERAQITKRWCFQKDGLSFVFVPSRGIHDRLGGTVSLGDTIDLSALLYERSSSPRGSRLAHLSSFS